MSDDIDAIRALLSASVPGVAHRFTHYLYFASKSDADLVATKLRKTGCDVKSRLGANDVSWLVLASHSMVPLTERVESLRLTLEQLAASNRGEYDGWEAEVRQPAD